MNQNNAVENLCLWFQIDFIKISRLAMTFVILKN